MLNPGALLVLFILVCVLLLWGPVVALIAAVALLLVAALV